MMDYTTKNRVKAEMQSSSTLTTQDSLLDLLITAASRAIDRHCTGVSVPEAVDYFKTETITAEILNALVDSKGRVSTYVHKPIVSSVTSFEYRARPFDPWILMDDITRVWPDRMSVTAWPVVSLTARRCQVRITYIGGYGADVASLPADLQEAATILTIRYFKEAESGLSDAIGIAELGTMTYTKAWPVRVLEMLQPYVRTVGWSMPG